MFYAPLYFTNLATIPSVFVGISALFGSLVSVSTRFFVLCMARFVNFCRNSYQVIGIYTSLVFAKMIDLKSVVNFSVNDFVRKTMGKHSCFGVNPKSSIGLFGGISAFSPNPTSVSFLNMLPKTVLNGLIINSLCVTVSIVCGAVLFAHSAGVINSVAVFDGAVNSTVFFKTSVMGSAISVFVLFFLASWVDTFSVHGKNIPQLGKNVNIVS